MPRGVLGLNAAQGANNPPCGELSIPAPAVAPPAVDQAETQQQDHGADKSVQDRRDDSDTQMNAEPGQEPIPDESADQADQQIPDQPETSAFHHTAGEPPGNDSDKNNDQQALVGKMHD